MTAPQHTTDWWIADDGDIATGHGEEQRTVTKDEILETAAERDRLQKAATELIYEFDQYYDVDDGRPNISGEIIKKVNALRAIVDWDDLEEIDQKVGGHTGSRSPL